MPILVLDSMFSEEIAIMPRKKITILFTCVGRRVSLIESFRRACKRLGYSPVIVGTDTTELSPALQCCDKKYLVPPVHQKGYARQVTDIIERLNVDLLIPTIDLDLPIWARKRQALKQIGCTALVSTPRVVRICQDKRLMFSFLSDHGFDTPLTISAPAALKLKKHHFPYFLKPWDGHASRGNVIVHNAEELKFYARRIPNCIVQHLAPGREHTIDALIDFQGRVRCVVPRRRIETRSGEVSKAITVKNPQMMQRATELIEKLHAGPGVVTIQCFFTPGQRLHFIEINPRFGGGIPLAIKAGADFPRWIIQLWLGQNPRISFDRWQDEQIMLRYDEAIWLQK